jgi:hypothetical protein
LRNLAFAPQACHATARSTSTLIKACRVGLDNGTRSGEEGRLEAA